MTAHPAVEQAVGRARRELRRCGVPADRRDAFIAELTVDLAEASDRGQTPEEALGDDPAAVARTFRAESLRLLVAELGGFRTPTK